MTLINVLHRGDSDYARLALMAVDRAQMSVKETEILKKGDGFLGIFNLLEQMKSRIPHQVPFDSSRPQLSHLSKDEEYKYREPVWQAIDAVLVDAELPDIEFGDTPEDHVTCLQNLLKHYLFFVQAEEVVQKANDELNALYTLYVGRGEEVVVKSPISPTFYGGKTSKAYLEDILPLIQWALKKLA